ncbi:MAG: acyl-ACP--UDP-N-acetylglucosamine O-acyltransferase [Bacteroidota bacterium]|jgi:UDP-N-acetylglucosamine acyltransferase|nr:acyl-ACP--UDP-N-acetylglucosamine O-acyltransferase [Bacteroidota bacterium]MCA6442797.1 acyl-ACP--UDP-N-acetylglucosamine O-acyltransferase [Bacteroidota bacterium]
MISNLANIHAGAQIGNNVTVSAFATIYDRVVIGDNVYIHPNAVIYPDTIIGDNCQIFPGAIIGVVNQDLKYKGEKSNTVIGNNTVIREYATIHKGTADRMTTKVGNNCLIMAYTHLGHDCIIGNNVIIANNGSLAGHITVEDYVVIEGVVAAQQFVTIGAHSFVAGASLVRKSVPPYVRVAREPLQFIGVNTIGLARRGFDKDLIKQIEDIYRIIFVRGHNISNALEIVENEIAESEVRNQILNFIKSQKDGIIKGI